jgi:cytochrome P450 family 13
MLGNVLIEEGNCVHVDVFGVHHNKEIFGEDADQFNPDRWLGGDSAKLMANFYPFGGGPRICIGMRLAYIEEKLLLVHILRRFNIRETPNTGVSTR